MDKNSYALGMKTGLDLLKSGVETLTQKDFNKGLKDILSGGETVINCQEMKKTLEEFLKSCKTKADERWKEMNRNWMNEQAFVNGTTTCRSGIQIKMLTKGDGEIPGENDKIICMFRIELFDGTVVNDCFTQKMVIDLPNTIPGLRQGIRTLPCGSTAEIHIPAELAYGEKGTGNTVPPNSALNVLINVIEIKK